MTSNVKFDNVLVIALARLSLLQIYPISLIFYP